MTAAFLLLAGAAFAEEAQDITSGCKFRTDSQARKYTMMTDGKYTSYWESGEVRDPFVSITSEQPVYGLYICFRQVPASYEIQTETRGGWKCLTEGDTRFVHVFYELHGEKKLRIQSTQSGKHRFGINEIFLFGEGDIPEWVQRWEEPEKKADILFLSTHPDDELIFFGGAIPTYTAELGKKVQVAYLSWSNTTRRSEALNGLWTLGVRHYPDFGGFPDSFSSTAKDAYAKAGKDKVLSWVTEIYRKYRPEAVVTQDIHGEYGHGQHRMVADAAIQCFDLAADAEKYPDSASEYGTWEVKKLYIHLYGDESNQIVMNWDIPLEKFGGRTGLELAAEAFALHKTQEGAKVNTHGKPEKLSVERTGSVYDNRIFGLYATRVGPDEIRNDFLEHIEE